MASVVALTPLGRQKGQAITEQGPGSAVLASLMEHGSSSLPDIGRATGLKGNRLKKVIKALMQAGYVKALKGDED